MTSEINTWKFQSLKCCSSAKYIPGHEMQIKSCDHTNLQEDIYIQILTTFKVLLLSTIVLDTLWGPDQSSYCSGIWSYLVCIVSMEKSPLGLATTRPNFSFLASFCRSTMHLPGFEKMCFCGKLALTCIANKFSNS